MVPALWEGQLPWSRHAHTCPVSQHTLQAELVSDKMQTTQCLHHRDTWGKSGRCGWRGTSNLGDTTPSTNTQQQVPEIKRKSEEKGWKTIRGVKELLRKKHTTGERVTWFYTCLSPSSFELTGSVPSPQHTQEHSLNWALHPFICSFIPQTHICQVLI